MKLDFQLEFLSTVVLLRDYQGNVVKTSRNVPIST